MSEKKKNNESSNNNNNTASLFFGFTENDSMKVLGRSSILEIIQRVPPAEKAAYIQALEKCPSLLEKESPVDRFLRVEDYNPWAAARRLLCYWKTRRAIFGQQRAFLPMDLTGAGAVSFENIAYMNKGQLILLPDDEHGRAVFCVDRSKHENAFTAAAAAAAPEHALRVLFFLLSQMSENPTSQRDGAVALIVLNNPDDATDGALFDSTKMARAAELVSQVLPLRLHKVHLAVCLPTPTTVVGGGGPKHADDTIVRMALKNVGPFFSDKAIVHVADTEAGLFKKLEPLGFQKENVPSFAGGTWEYGQFVQWQQKRGLIVPGLLPEEEQEAIGAAAAAAVSVSDPDSQMASLVKDTLDKYSSKLLQDASSSIEGTQEQSGSEQTDNKDNACVIVPWNASSEIVELQQMGLAVIEKDAILRDIYGSIIVPLITKQVEEESRALAELQTVILGMDASEKNAYLEAVKRAPDLVELESGPLRFLSCNNMDPELSAKRLVLYWEKRQALFGDRAFLPLVLKGESALSNKAIELVETGMFSVLPHDTRGRIVVLINRSRLSDRLKMYPVSDKMQAVFYMLSVLSERQESRHPGVVGVSVLPRAGAVSSGKDRNGGKFAFGMIDLLSSGALPIRLKAHHVICQQATHMQILMARVLGFTARWSFLNERLVLHAFERDKDMLAGLKRYGFTGEGIPGLCGGLWNYTSFSNFIQEREVVEKTLYPREKVGSANGGAKSEQDPATILAKKRRMEVIYGQRKRERLRIEVEVTQEQCKQFGDKNVRLAADNQRLEGLIVAANAEVARYEQVQSCAVNALGYSAEDNFRKRMLQSTLTPLPQFRASGITLSRPMFHSQYTPAQSLVISAVSQPTQGAYVPRQPQIAQLQLPNQQFATTPGVPSSQHALMATIQPSAQSPMTPAVARAPTQGAYVPGQPHPEQQAQKQLPNQQFAAAPGSPSIQQQLASLNATELLALLSAARNVAPPPNIIQMDPPPPPGRP